MGPTTPGKGTGGSLDRRQGFAKGLGARKTENDRGLACCSPCLVAALVAAGVEPREGGRRTGRGTAQLEEALSNCA